MAATSTLVANNNDVKNVDNMKNSVQTVPLLLLDLDNTLFETSKFWQVFVYSLSKAAHVNVEQVDDREKFTKGKDKMRYTDYGGMLRQFKVSHAQVEDALKYECSGIDFLFPDAHILLNRISDVGHMADVSILTFGEPRFQKLKFDVVPELQEFPIYIVRELKYRHIAKNLAHRFGILIDDKPDQMLPDGWLEVHLDRKLSKVKELSDDNVIRITSLSDFSLNNIIR